MRRMESVSSKPVLRYFKPLALMAALLVLGNPALGDSHAEREALARLSHEIEALEPLIRSAESQANPDARIRFRYDWLRQDLARVRLGIQEHIDAPRAEPRTFPPLRGDYRR